jgi:polysaccharide biosynthesis/export protein
MQKVKLFSLFRFTLLFIIFSTVSCVPYNKVRYFNDINELEGPEINPRTQKLIMPFDKLFIKVLSIDPQTSQIFSNADEIRSSGLGGTDVLGYMVDENGNINFPFVGTINVNSMTAAQASAKIEKELSAYVPTNTSVIVKFIDNQVTVMGEVERQGVYPFTQDKLNIYQALSLGGGLTRYGDRKNIILTRQKGEKILHYRLNLSNSKIATKDYYFILPNDVIIVEPLKTVSSSYQNITYTTILTSITTLIAVLLFTGVKF